MSLLRRVCVRNLYEHFHDASTDIRIVTRMNTGMALTWHTGSKHERQDTYMCSECMRVDHKMCESVCVSMCVYLCVCVTSRVRCR